MGLGTRDVSFWALALEVVVEVKSGVVITVIVDDAVEAKAEVVSRRRFRGVPSELRERSSRILVLNISL